MPVCEAYVILRSMQHLLEKYKPAANATTHLLMAALMWLVVGVLLAGFGLKWLAHSSLAFKWPLAALAVALGMFKSRFALDKAAHHMVDRIAARGDGRCIGGFLSPWSWLMVAIMAGGGRALRAWVLPKGWAGLLYLMVGVALALSSRLLWHKPHTQPQR